jgi:ComEC/Rec2-related protein
MITRYFHFMPLKLPQSFWWAISLMAGIGLGYSHKAPLVAFCIALYCHPKKLSLCFFFMLGVLLCLEKTRSKLPISQLKNVVLQGKVTDKTFIDHPCWRHRLRLNVTKFKTEQGWIEYPFEVYIYTQKRNSSWVQDIIECGPITIKEPSDKDFFLYLCREGVAGTSFAPKLPYKKIKRPKQSFLNWLFWQRELLQIKLRKKMSPQTFAFFSSLFFGNRQSIKSRLEEYKPLFKEWGILHHLARSGLHLIIFIMLWHYFLNFLPLPFIFKHLLTLGITLLYLLFSWSSLSFLRAFTLYVFYKLATLFKLKLHPIHAISSACLLLLIHNPVHLFFLDFQLSFLLSFCLLWIAHVRHQRRTSLYKSIAAKHRKALS